MRTCRDCKESKPETEFKKRKENRINICKSCANIRNTVYRNLNKQTFNGWSAQAWRNLNRRAKNQDGRHPTYINIEVRMSKDEFLTWAAPRFEQWIKECKQYTSPTLDRIDPMGHYEISNLQLLSKRDNASKSGNFSEIEHFIRFIKRQAIKLGISNELVAELIIKEQNEKPASFGGPV